MKHEAAELKLRHGDVLSTIPHAQLVRVYDHQLRAALCHRPIHAISNLAIWWRIFRTPLLVVSDVITVGVRDADVRRNSHRPQSSTIVIGAWLSAERSPQSWLGGCTRRCTVRINPVAGNERGFFESSMGQNRVTERDFGWDSWGQKRVTKGVLKQPDKATGNKEGSEIGFELNATTP
ncbi:hypothetical protein K438DRAFT_1780188 [Mycena galopus ATCC 62051]|nr:hypothetical protein K438DRAFT_1780188 [Mycena galopus ATCC 62051]